MKFELDYAIAIMTAMSEDPAVQPGISSDFPPPEILPPAPARQPDLGDNDPYKQWTRNHLSRYYEHCKLLSEAGYIQIAQGSVGFPIRLTYAGHEFLGNMADPDVCDKVTDGAKRGSIKTLTIAYEVALKLATEAALKYFT